MGKLIELKTVSFIFIFCLYSFQVHALDLRGYVIGQSVLSQNQLSNSSHKITSLGLANINRFNLIHAGEKSLTYEAGLELTQLYEQIYNPNFFRSKSNNIQNYRVSDFKQVWLANESSGQSKNYYILGNIDRLSLSWEGENFGFVLGRQQISFGSSKMTNPIDIFAPFGPVTVNAEERSGIDAIRLRGSIGDMGEWDTGIIFGEKAQRENSGAYITAKLPWKNFEFQPILVNFKEANLYGMDILLSQAGANFWFEGARVQPDNTEAYTRYTLGAEYQWGDQLFTIIEYHFNGAGASTASNYSLLPQTFAYSKGSVFYLGKQYLSLLINSQLSPLQNLSAGLNINSNDHSSLFSAAWDWSLSNELALNLGLYIGLGTKSINVHLPESEFGLVGEVYFLKLRQYF